MIGIGQNMAISNWFMVESVDSPNLVACSFVAYHVVYFGVCAVTNLRASETCRLLSLINIFANILILFAVLETGS